VTVERTQVVLAHAVEFEQKVHSYDSVSVGEFGQRFESKAGMLSVERVEAVAPNCDTDQAEAPYFVFANALAAGSR
jgi:hypothetical protein